MVSNKEKISFQTSKTLSEKNIRLDQDLLRFFTYIKWKTAFSYLKNQNLDVVVHQNYFIQIKYSLISTFMYRPSCFSIRDKITRETDWCLARPILISTRFFFVEIEQCSVMPHFFRTHSYGVIGSAQSRSVKTG